MNSTRPIFCSGGHVVAEGARRPLVRPGGIDPNANPAGFISKPDSAVLSQSSFPHAIATGAVSRMTLRALPGCAPPGSARRSGGDGSLILAIRQNGPFRCHRKLEWPGRSAPLPEVGFRLLPDVQFEVIVVDNASGDDSVATMEREFPQVVIVRNQRNQGLPSPTTRPLRSPVAGTFCCSTTIPLFCRAPWPSRSAIWMPIRRWGAGLRVEFPDRSFQTSCYRFTT